MGHEIEIMSFPTSKSLESIKKEIYLEYNCGKIRFIDNLFANRELAQEYIEKNDRGWYDCLAVKYKHINRNELPQEHQKAMKELDSKLQETEYRLRNLEWNIEAFSLKKDIVECKHCESKINIRHIHSNYYPICRNDMRSQKRHNLLNELNREVDTIKEEIFEKEKELFNKYGTSYWLVKIEYRNE